MTQKTPKPGLAASGHQVLLADDQRFFRLDDRIVKEGVGIKPNIEVTDKIADMASGKDTVLQKAI